MINKTYDVCFDCQVKDLSKIYEKYFGYPSKGIFVEVGAFDGQMVSNTSCLADHGWRGVYIEPIYEYYLRCVERNKNNKNVECYNYAIGEEEKVETIYVSDALTTMVNDYPDMYRKMEVFRECNLQFSPSSCNQIRLDTLLERINVPQYFDILVVDVEGKESEVFRSFDLEYWKPKMMIVELADNHSSFQEYSEVVEDHKKLREIIKSKNYIEIYSDEINTIFVNKTFERKTNMSVSESNNKGVSVICACKNRYDPLMISLNSWLLFDEIKEIVIVDWNSDKKLNHLTKLDSRIKIVTVFNEEYFNQPQPLNLAARFCSQEYLLKLDTDYILSPYFSFFEKYQVDDTNFLQGPIGIENERIANDPYFKNLRGILYIKKENFDKVGGYNENMSQYYAWEDDELCSRLEILGLKLISLNYDHSVIHIPHSDKKRFENFEGDKEYEKQVWNDLSQTYQGDELNWQFEYVISQYHIQKNKSQFQNPDNYYIKSDINWNIIQLDDQNYFAEKL